MEAKETKDDSAETPEDASEDTSDAEPAAEKRPAEPLPPKVESALAKARAAARADNARKSGRWLALIPVGIGVVLMLLMMPRATPPDGIPIPRADYRVIDNIARAEDKLAAEAEQQRLPGDILAVGSAIRDLNTASETDDQSAAIETRHRLDAYLADAMRRPGGEQDLIRLRAVQTRVFLDAVSAWERGEPPKDFVAAGGAFVKRAEEAGWVNDHHVALSEPERRIAFKTMWNVITHLDRSKYALALDEERAMYAFYIQHPHVGETARISMEQARRSSTTPELCAQTAKEAHRLEGLWIADKVKRLAAIDPAYPGMYALGVAYWQAGRRDLSVDAFNLFIEQHPDGAYSLRAKNHLKAALTAP